MQTKHILPILLILFTQAVFAQNKNSFIESQQTIPLQKLYLHTDREFYFFGDTIWFAGYLLHPQTHAPLKTDCNLYVEITDSAGNSVQKETFPILQGFCPGQLALNKPELKEGNYLIRAYTDLLSAYGGELIFSKPLRISPVKNSAGFQSEQKNELVADINLDLFPEGGFLLAGKYNQMAFKVTEPSGKDVEVRGRLLNSKGEELMKFSSLYRGMGIIYFIPEQGENYTIEIDGFPNVTYSFPKVSDSGAKLMIYRENPDCIDVDVVLKEENNNQKYYVASLTRGELNSFGELDRNKKENIVHIEKGLLKTGINRVVLLNENFEPVSERLVFVDKADDARLTINLNKLQFNPREKVEIEIEGDKNIGRNEISSLSVSVIDKNSIPESGVTQNIKSYLFIDSELKGYISNPADYFVNEPQISSVKKLDLLMMTHGWSNYIWNSLTKDEKVPEFETRLGLTIAGTLKNYFETKKLVGSEVILSVSGETDEFMAFTQTDSLGNYKFNNVQFYDSATIFVQGKDKRDKPNTAITLDSIHFVSPEATSTEKAMAEQFTKIPVPMLRTKYFNEAKLKEFFPDRDTRLIEEVRVTANKPEEEKNQGRIKIYTEPTHTVELKENAYAYPNIMEYLAGRVPGRLDSSWLFLIDGVEVFSTKSFSAYDYVTSVPMGDIERVEILKHAAGAFYGMRGRKGVINIIIKKGGEYTPSSDILKGTIVKRIKGFSSYREFYSPEYTNENIHSEVPDYRTTLYWNPSIAGEDGKVGFTFFTCDNVANYKIFVEGITENGTICLGEAEFEVNGHKDSVVASHDLQSNQNSLPQKSKTLQSVDENNKSIEPQKTKTPKDKYITGIIKNYSEHPVEFATLLNITKNTTCITNNAGEFKLEAEAGDTVLVQHLNYKTYNFLANQSINIVLSNKDFFLDEVIVSAGFAARLFELSCRNTFKKFKEENVSRAYSQILRTDNGDTTQTIDMDLDIVQKKRKNFKRGEKVSLNIIQGKNVLDSSKINEKLKLKIIDFYPQINWVQFNDNFTYTKTEDTDFIKLCFRPKKILNDTTSLTEVCINKQDTTLSSVIIVNNSSQKALIQKEQTDNRDNSDDPTIDLTIDNALHYFSYDYSNGFSYLSECYSSFRLHTNLPYKEICLYRYIKTYNNGADNLDKRSGIKKMAGNELNINNFESNFTDEFWKKNNYLKEFRSSSINVVGFEESQSLSDDTKKLKNN